MDELENQSNINIDLPRNSLEINAENNNYNSCWWYEYSLGNVVFWNWTGRLFTMANVVPLGMYSALFVYFVLKNRTSPVISVACAGILGIAAMIGKYAVISSFNVPNFEKLAEIKWCELKEAGANLQITSFIKYTILYVLSITASAVFTNLGWIGMDAASTLSQKFHTKQGRIFSKNVSSLPVQVPIAVATMLSNVLSLRGVIPYSYNNAKNIFLTLILIISHSQRQHYQLYLNTQAKIYAARKPLIISVNKLITKLKESTVLESDYSDTLSELRRIFPEIIFYPTTILSPKNELRNLLNEIQERKLLENKETIRQKFIVSSPENMQVSLWKHSAAIAITLVLSGITIAGLTNFWFFAVNLAEKIQLDVIAPFIAFIDMIVMVELGLLTLNYKDTFSGMLNVSLKKEPVRLLNINFDIFLCGIAGVLCALGGFGNAYQAILAKQGTFLVAASLFAPAWIEWNGTNNLFRSYFEPVVINKIKKKCDFIELLLELTNSLNAIEADLPDDDFQCVFESLCDICFFKRSANENYMTVIHINEITAENNELSF